MKDTLLSPSRSGRPTRLTAGGGLCKHVLPPRLKPHVSWTGTADCWLTWIWFINHGTYLCPPFVEGDFEWDSEKAASNLVEHGVSFAEAATVFADPLAVYLDDGSGPGNMVVIGTSLQERVLCVVHLERSERDRIISARSATAGEREVYESGGNP